MTTTTNTVTITGKTYNARTWLKECGFGWDAKACAWVGGADALAELRRTSTAVYSRSNAKLVSTLVINDCAK